MSDINTDMLKVCAHDTLQTTCGNLPNLLLRSIWDKDDWLDWEIQRSKVNVTERPHTIK